MKTRHMRSRRPLTLLLVIAVVAAGLWFSGDTTRRSITFSNRRPCHTGSFRAGRRRFRGVDVGKVSLIRFDPKDPRAILIEIAAFRPNTPVTRGTYAEIRPQGFTGLSYVMLLDDSGGIPSACRRQGEQCAAHHRQRRRCENLFAASEGAVADIRDVAQRVSKLLNDENQQRVEARPRGSSESDRTDRRRRGRGRARREEHRAARRRRAQNDEDR